MQINPGLSFAQLSPTHLQIGSGYRALELTGVSQPVRTFIQCLRDGIADGDEHKVATECQVSELDCHLILTNLAPLLVTTPAKEHFVISADPDHRGNSAAPGGNLTASAGRVGAPPELAAALREVQSRTPGPAAAATEMAVASPRTIERTAASRSSQALWAGSSTMVQLAWRPRRPSMRHCMGERSCASSTTMWP